MEFLNSIYSYLVENAGTIATQFGLALAVFIGFYALSRVLSRGAEAAMNRTDRGQLLSQLVSKAVHYTILAVGLVMALDQLGFNIKAVLAGAGVLGIAIGFGAQELVRDVISGFFIILAGTLKKGDYVEVGEASGTVEQVTLRQTRIRSLNGELWYIPNGKVTTIVNHSRDWKRVVVDVGLAYEQDVARGLQALQSIGEDWAEEHPEESIAAPQAQGVTRLGDSSVGVRLLLRVNVAPPRTNAIARDIRKRIKAVFDEEGIEIPFPRQVVYHRTEEAEPAPELAMTSLSEVSG